MTIGSFPELVASDAPTPGGGSVAALAGALAAALAQMVCGLTIGKKKYADVEAEAKQFLKGLSPLAAALTRAIDEDAESFDMVMLAFKLPKATDEEKALRADAIEQATKARPLFRCVRQRLLCVYWNRYQDLRKSQQKRFFPILQSERKWRNPPCGPLSIMLR